MFGTLNEDLIISTVKKIGNGKIFSVGYRSEVPIKYEYKRLGLRITKFTEKCVRSGVNYSKIKEVILKFNCLQLLNITLTNIQLTLNDVNCFLLKCTNLVNLSLKKPECSIYCIYPLVKNLNKFTTIRTFIIQDIIISSFQFFDFSEDFIKSFLYSFSKCFFIEIFRVSKNSPIINLDRKKYKVNNEFPLCFCFNFLILLLILFLVLNKVYIY